MPKEKRWGVWIAVLLVLFVTVSIALLVMWKRDQSKVDPKPGETLVVRSSSFTDNGTIPAKYTCDGGNQSPELAVSSVPSGTRSLTLIAEDPDAPIGTFVHWVAFNLPPNLQELPEGASAPGGVEGRNDFEKVGYGGPCPPAGKPHHYVFHIYALDTILPLQQGATRREVADAGRGHVLAEGKIVGLYGRGK
jgi:hypothetical protein